MSEVQAPPAQGGTGPAPTLLLLLPPSVRDFRAAKERKLAVRMMPLPAAGAPPPR